MRMIGSLESSQHAKRLSAYLLTEGIKSQIEPEDAVWEVWIKDEDHLDKAKKLLAEFQNEPDHERYRTALAEAEAIQRKQEKKRREYQKNLRVGAQTVEKKNPMTITLIVICGIVALVTSFAAISQRPAATMQALVYNTISPDQLEQILEDRGESGGRLSPEFLESNQVRNFSIMHGQIWRLITPIFIHFDALHIVFNMIWLFQFGRKIEHRYGTVYLGILVLFIAIVSNFAQGTVPEGIGGSVPGPLSGSGNLSTMFGGMSGVVYGLLGFIWIKSSVDPESRISVSPTLVMIMLVLMFFCMTPLAAQTTIFSNVANWAHGIGLLAGLFAGYFLTLIRK